MRQVSLTTFGRSAALIIATVGDDGADFLLTVSGGNAAAGAVALHDLRRRRPNCDMPSTSDCRRTPVSTTCTDRRPYKRHITLYLAEQIRAELA